MAQCNFSIPLSATPEATAQKAEAAIRKAGGTFAGNEALGTFRLSTPLGGVGGTYRIMEGAIHISINEKPLFVGCGMIEQELKKYLNR